MSDDLFFADVCVCCGCILPEGEMICNECKHKLKNGAKPEKEFCSV